MISVTCPKCGKTFEVSEVKATESCPYCYAILRQKPQPIKRCRKCGKPLNGYVSQEYTDLCESCEDDEFEEDDGILFF